MICRSSDARELDQQHALRGLTHPWRLGAVRGTEAEVPACRIIAVAFEMRPVVLGIGKAWAGLEQKNVEPAFADLFGNDSSSAASPDNNHVAHVASSTKDY